MLHSGPKQVKQARFTRHVERSVIPPTTGRGDNSDRRVMRVFSEIEDSRITTLSHWTNTPITLTVVDIVSAILDDYRRSREYLKEIAKQNKRWLLRRPHQRYSGYSRIKINIQAFDRDISAGNGQVKSAKGVDKDSQSRSDDDRIYHLHRQAKDSAIFKERCSDGQKLLRSYEKRMREEIIQVLRSAMTDRKSVDFSALGKSFATINQGVIDICEWIKEAYAEAWEAAARRNKAR
ncbi:hypothetical protein NM208_g3120 [Fusarium decemcellulare]|uniref:Uncharacterized protein n=1 Tax=Fusarium decemcellulare TaxID=57161 RepID=A0ACC1SQB3_9HYPO|nr:hypothetical protein NM208_g3120 [Fusarium decemcellulare]